MESCVKKGKHKIGVIQAFCKEIALKNYEIQIMLQLYESIFLSNVLFNCQSWTNLTNTHIESLQTLQIKHLKQTMCVPYFTPNKGTLLELGMNYKSKYVNNWKCRLYSTEEESYSHLFTCEEYGEDIEEITKGLNELDPNCIFQRKQTQ